ncbi:MAG: beta-lactamase family protein [Thermoleophilia bacterium]|nr:beta-lactamase family protein [Thermoleophilia bacterium]
MSPTPITAIRGVAGLGLTVAALTLVACGTGPGGQRALEAAPLAADLDELVAAAVELDPDVPGVALTVLTSELDWSGAAGVADPASDEPLEPVTPLRIASNTKTLTAAAVFRLQELGALDVDDPIAAHLPPALVERLPGGKEITVRQLLRHESGLYDFATDPAYLRLVAADPGRRWTPLEQVELALELGEPYGRPGATVHYSDTGYVLASLIIERASGQPLPAALRDLLGFERLGLASTWLESLEPAPAGVPARAHQYLGDVDTYGFDPSFDLYGAGGLVSTTGDLARFWRALFAGEVFESDRTLEDMLAPAPGSGVASGLVRTSLGGHVAWTHDGFWGTGAMHVPDLGVTIVMSLGQHEGADEAAAHVLAGLARALALPS